MHCVHECRVPYASAPFMCLHALRQTYMCQCTRKIDVYLNSYRSLFKLHGEAFSQGATTLGNQSTLYIATHVQYINGRHAAYSSVGKVNIACNICIYIQYVNICIHCC